MKIGMLAIQGTVSEYIDMLKKQVQTESLLGKQKKREDLVILQCPVTMHVT